MPLIGEEWRIELHVIVVFIDGVGLGEPSLENPFVFTETPFLKKLLRGNPLTRETSGFHNEEATLWALDAQLGVSGLPQSATGQATLFTGINAPRRLGYHLNGFPNQPLRELLAAEGIFASLREKGYRCTFVNAYRPKFFEKLKQGLPGSRYSCSTLVTYYGKLPFYNLDDLKAGKAPVSYTHLDRIEAGTFMITAAATGGEIVVEEVIPKHLEAVTAKLRETGAEVEVEPEQIRVHRNGPLVPSDLKTFPYPGFPTDLQPLGMVLLTAARGTSIVTENVFDGRFRHVDELKRMGAQIKVDGRTAVIDGGVPLSGAPVSATDLRAGVAVSYTHLDVYKRQVYARA